MGVRGYDPWRDIERHRSWVNQVNENAGRLAQAFGVFETTGWGETAFEDVVEFGITFIQPPALGYGFRIVSAADLPDGNEDETLVDTRFPRCSGGIHEYKQDSRGFYTGAWCLATVDTLSPYISTVYPDPNYLIEHWFTFTGVALKMLPAEAMREVDI